MIDLAISPARTREEPVHFFSSGEPLAGTFYRPDGQRSDEPHPAVVVTGAWATVKEQMAARYARALATRGTAALTFDFRSWGESGGRPRSMEDPSAKADDIVAAARYLATRPDVEPSSVGALGVCASAAYLATAATRSESIASVVLVAPALPTRATVAEHIGGDAGARHLRDVARRAEDSYRETGVEQLEAAVAIAPQEATPAADYYGDPTRGNVPEWDNTFNPASWLTWLEYDAHAAAQRLTQPLLVVHSDAAVNPPDVREFVARVPGPVDQLWLPEVTQFDFYDQPGPVSTAADAAVRHFDATLRPTRAGVR